MKKLIIACILLTGSATAEDIVIPWADNSGDTESHHIAEPGQNLNAQHLGVTKTQEGLWADGSGSIAADEAALTSNKPVFAGDPKLMPHQG